MTPEPIIQPPEQTGAGENIALYRRLYCRVDDAHGIMLSSGPVASRERLTDAAVMAHLEGRERIGAYLLDKDGLTDRLVFDIDSGDSGLARQIVTMLDEMSLQSYIVSSKSRGFHVYAHFEPTPAATLRRLGRYIVHRVGAPDTEVFPKQDRRADGGLGNFVWLPLHGGSLREGRTAILNEGNGLDPMPDQWGCLAQIQDTGINSRKALDEVMPVVEAWERETGNAIAKAAPPVGDVIPDGQRSNTLISLAGTLRRKNLGQDSIDAVLLNENARKCVPPLPEAEVLKIARRYEGNYPPPDPKETVIEEIEAVYASGDLPTATTAAWKAIERKNDPPRIFIRGGIPVRIGKDEEDRDAFEELTVDRLRHEVARAAPWKAFNRKGVEIDAKPPLDIVRDMLATTSGRMPLPPVQRLVCVPTIAPDGSICASPGYNAPGRVYYAPTPGLFIPEVPTHPSDDDVDEAQALIFELFADFPFKEAADLTHAVGFLLLPFIRSLVDGPAPITLFEAPVHGSGKGLARDVALIPSTGGTIGIVTFPDENELRKLYTSRLLKGQDIISLDNVSRLDSSVLSAAVTAYPYWSDRHLGQSKELTLPCRHTVWSVTANNPTLSGEVARRCIRVRIEPNVERPWERETFKHPNLRLWAAENRGRLVAAALTICRAWIVDGMAPWRERTLGSFEAWSGVMGGILARAGFKDFLTNLDALYEATDLETAAWHGLVTAWHTTFGTRAVGTAELFPLAEKIEGIDLGKGGTDRSMRLVFAKRLHKMDDRIMCGYKITRAGKYQGGVQWCLIPVG